MMQLLGYDLVRPAVPLVGTAFRPAQTTATPTTPSATRRSYCPC